MMHVGNSFSCDGLNQSRFSRLFWRLNLSMFSLDSRPLGQGWQGHLHTADLLMAAPTCEAGEDEMDRFPNMTFHFGDATFVWRAQGYMSLSTVCIERA